MKIFVFGYDRYHTTTTSAMLEKEGIDHWYLIHDADKYEKFAEAGKVMIERLVVTGQPKGLPFNRNYALDWMEEGEWALFLVDDFISLTELDSYLTSTTERLPIDTTNSTEFGRRFKTELTFRDFLLRCGDCITQAQEEGANLVGFAAYENPLFRASKWKRSGLCEGRCLLVKKTHLRFDTNAVLMDDYCFTALNLREFGKVLCNQWILPNCARYTPGGCGTKEERMKAKIAECAYLVNTYPDQIRYAEKKGWPDGSHIAIRGGDHDPKKKEPEMISLF